MQNTTTGKIVANNTVGNVQSLAKDMLDVLIGISKFKPLSFDDYKKYIDAGWDDPKKYIADYGKHYAINSHSNTNRRIYNDILLVIGLRRRLYKSSISPEMRNLPSPLLANMIEGIPLSVKFPKISYVLEKNKKALHLLLTDIANNRAFGGDDWQEWQRNPMSWLLKNKPKEVRDLYDPDAITNIIFSPIEEINRSIIDAFHLVNANSEDGFIAFSWTLRVLQEERNNFNERIIFPANPFGPLSCPHIEFLPALFDSFGQSRTHLLSNGNKTSLKRFAKNVIDEQLGLGDREQNRNFRKTLEFRILEQYPNEVREIVLARRRADAEVFPRPSGSGLDSKVFPRPHWFTPEIEKEFHRRVTWLSTSADLSYEGEVMQHCVGSYKNSCRNGHSAIFNVITPAGRSTMEIRNDFRGSELYVNQHRAVRNSPPPEENIKLGNEFLEKVKENEQ